LKPSRAHNHYVNVTVRRRARAACTGIGLQFFFIYPPPIFHFLLAVRCSPGKRERPASLAPYINPSLRHFESADAAAVSSNSSARRILATVRPGVWLVLSAASPFFPPVLWTIGLWQQCVALPRGLLARPTLSRRPPTGKLAGLFFGALLAKLKKAASFSAFLWCRWRFLPAGGQLARPFAAAFHPYPAGWPFLPWRPAGHFFFGPAGDTLARFFVLSFFLTWGGPAPAAPGRLIAVRFRIHQN